VKERRVCWEVIGEGEGRIAGGKGNGGAGKESIYQKREASIEKSDSLNNNLTRRRFLGLKVFQR